MKAKHYAKLTDNQKLKVNKLVHDAANRTAKTIDFLEYLDNEDKKATVYLDSIDIYFKHCSDILFSVDFKELVLKSIISNYGLSYKSAKI